jgi:hypothetical protein
MALDFCIPYKRALVLENTVMWHFSVIFDWLQQLLAILRPSTLISFVSTIFKYSEGGWEG